MIKMELMVWGVLLLHIPLLLIILWRIEASVKLLKKQVKVTEAERALREKSLEQDKEVTECENANKVVEKLERNLDIREDELTIVNSRNCEKEKLINEVLSEIFS